MTYNTLLSTTTTPTDKFAHEFFSQILWPLLFVTIIIINEIECFILYLLYAYCIHKDSRVGNNVVPSSHRWHYANFGIVLLPAPQTHALGNVLSRRPIKKKISPVIVVCWFLKFRPWMWNLRGNWVVKKREEKLRSSPVLYKDNTAFFSIYRTELLVYNGWFVQPKRARLH